MPIYEYQCLSCSQVTEVMRRGEALLALLLTLLLPLSFSHPCPAIKGCDDVAAAGAAAAG